MLYLKETSTSDEELVLDYLNNCSLDEKFTLFWKSTKTGKYIMIEGVITKKGQKDEYIITEKK